MAMNGFSGYFCFGKYGGFSWEVSGAFLRVVLGWFSFGLGFWDIEREWDSLVAEIKHLTRQ